MGKTEEELKDLDIQIFAADEPGSRFVRVMGGAEVDRLVAGGRVKLLEIEGGDHVFSPPGSRRSARVRAPGVRPRQLRAAGR